ncbi:MAG: serine/threonine-protein phosphatase 6 regulatory ankyrin repeat subunit B-like [Planctomycetaceae bacterium]|nr:serine/threonine-protein phosphatase 6 regulatory ankyrin repeat subunit B-like [Planctomycetaceae bacterium]
MDTSRWLGIISIVLVQVCLTVNTGLSQTALPPNRSVVGAKSNKAATEIAESQKARLDQLLVDYKAYGLPLPPADADFVVRRRQAGTVNNQQVFAYSFAFRERGNEPKLFWVGCDKIAARNDIEIAEVLTLPTAPSIDAYETTLEGNHNGFDTFPETAIAIQCVSRGWYAAASRLLEWPRKHRSWVFFVSTNSPPPPRDSRVAVARLAWNYWSNEFARSTADRRPIIGRLKYLRDARPELNTLLQRTVILDMEATCAERKATTNPLEVLIDSLVEVGRTDEQNQGISSFAAYSQPNHDGYAKLHEAGLTALPVLTNHLQDFRLTRCINRADYSAWHVRISEVVTDLLREIIRGEIAFDFHIDEGRGMQADLAHILYWWSGVQKEEALTYLLTHLTTVSPDGNPRANGAVLHVLGRRYPDELIKLYPSLIEKLGESQPLLSAVRNSQASAEPRTKLFLTAARDPNVLTRIEAIRGLLDVNYPESTSLLVKELDALAMGGTKSALPRNIVRRITEAVVSTNDEAAWSALQRMSGRVAARDRMEILETVGGNLRFRDRALPFIGYFLNDTDTVTGGGQLESPKMQQSAHAVDERSVSVILERSPSKEFKLAVGDVAALYLAPELGIVADPERSWGTEQWTKLRAETQSAFAEFQQWQGRKRVARRAPEVGADRQRDAHRLVFDELVKAGHVLEMETMLRAEPWLAKSGWSPLRAAANHGHLGAAKLLLDYGVDPNLDQNGWGYDQLSNRTPLSWAVAYGHYDVAELLCRRGARANIAGSPGENGYPNILHQAAADLDLRYLKLLLEHGGEVNSQDIYKSVTPLHLAANLGDLEKCALLVKHDAAVNIRSAHGATPLMFAALSGHQPVNKFLLSQDADLDIYSACALGKLDEVKRMLAAEPALINKPDGHMRRTPLIWAAGTGQLDVIELLLKLGADVKVRVPQFFQAHDYFSGPHVFDDDDKIGETALHVAAAAGHSQVIPPLLENGADINALHREKRTPIELAVENKRSAAAKALFERNAEYDNESAEKSLLSYAIESPEITAVLLTRKPGPKALSDALKDAAEVSPKVAAVLVAYGVKPDEWTASILGDTERLAEILEAKPRIGNVPQYELIGRAPLLELAARNGHAKTVAWFIENGLEINPLNNPPLHAAAEGGHADVVKMLLEMGAKVNHEDDWGETALIHAAKEGRAAIIQLLLQRGANVSVVSPRRNIAINCAAANGSVEAVRLLVEAGSDVNAQGESNRTPLHEAVRGGHTKLVDYLMNAGADVNARESSGLTPLTLAVTETDPNWADTNRYNPEIIKLLRIHGGVK